MKPLALLGAILVMGAAGAVFLLAPRGPQITLADAVLAPMGDGWALSVGIDNPGAPDRLISVTSDAAQTMVMGASFEAGLPIPGGSAPGLSMDGAHGMLIGLEAPQQGRLVPVTLGFQRAGAVSTRARVTGTAMAHDALYEVPGDEAAPGLALRLRADGDGWQVTAETQDFSFSRDAVDGPHQPGVGHAHLYLDGLKLQRMYGPEARIGPLLPGSYEVRVTLNTNDHRAYAVGGAPVTATARIEAD